jgi:hypothetical protein
MHLISEVKKERWSLKKKMSGKKAKMKNGKKKNGKLKLNFNFYISFF